MCVKLVIESQLLDGNAVQKQQQLAEQLLVYQATLKAMGTKWKENGFHMN